MERSDLRKMIREEIARSNGRERVNELFNGYEDVLEQIPYIEGQIENILMAAGEMGGHNRNSQREYTEYSEKLIKLKLDLKNSGPYTLKGKVKYFEEFLDWYEDGNAVRHYRGDMCFSTQDAQWRNRICGGWKMLHRYWVKEFR
jgi:hypothetical protein